MSTPNRNPDVVSTHVMVPITMKQALQQLSGLTRVHQSVYMRDVMAWVLENRGNDLGPLPGPRLPAGRNVSVVFRVTSADLKALEELSARTRVRQSEYLREGLYHVLKDNGFATWETQPEALTEAA